MMLSVPTALPVVRSKRKKCQGTYDRIVANASLSKRPLRMRAKILKHGKSGLMAGEARDSHPLTARQALAQRRVGGNFIDSTDSNLCHG